MPSREPELYKDKIEVSLDGRQIFYLFFGGAVIVGLVFVLGVMVGRRISARGHLDRADTQAASDPLAALDKLERSDDLSFHGALTGSEASTDVEKTIGELEKRRAGGKPDGEPRAAASARSAQAGEGKPSSSDQAHKDDKTEARTGKAEKAEKAEKLASRSEPDADKPKTDKRDGDKRDGDKRDGDKRDGDKQARKHDDDDEKRSDTKADKPVTRPEARDAKSESKSESKNDSKSDKSSGKSGEGKRYTLQLSSFQDRSEAEAFLRTMKSAGFQPYVTEAEVSGKGTFYRVRLGSFRSMDAANDAKAEYEKSAKKSAQVMRL